LMNQLFCYMKRSDKEPLLQLALILAQLLIIHPFMDGNGRIARLLIPLFLYKKKVLPSPFFFLSGYFKYRRLRYFQTLFKTTKENNWEEWIRFFLRGIRISAKKQTRTLMHIASLYENLAAQMLNLSQKTRDFLFQNPIFSIASFKKAKGSNTDLRKLKKMKLIRQGKNNKLYFSALMRILHNFQKQ
jgi:Fic family protein